MARCRSEAATGVLTWSSWPSGTELMAWATSAGAILDLAGGPPNASDASLDFALLAARPIISLSGLGEVHPAHRLDPDATSAELAQVLASIFENQDRTFTIPLARTPRNAADQLFSMLDIGCRLTGRARRP